MADNLRERFGSLQIGIFVVTAPMAASRIYGTDQPLTGRKSLHRMRKTSEQREHRFEKPILKMNHYHILTDWRTARMKMQRLLVGSIATAAVAIFLLNHRSRSASYTI
jgi:hypothetical protein